MQLKILADLSTQKVSRKRQEATGAKMSSKVAAVSSEEEIGLASGRVDDRQHLFIVFICNIKKRGIFWAILMCTFFVGQLLLIVDGGRFSRSILRFISRYGNSSGNNRSVFLLLKLFLFDNLQAK